MSVLSLWVQPVLCRLSGRIKTKEFNMDFLDTFMDGASALGNGVYSVGEDLVMGAHRTAESYGLNGSARVGQIGAENEYLAKNLYATITKGPTLVTSPLGKTIHKILEHSYAKLPEEVVRDLAIKAGVIGGGYIGGRAIIGTKLAKAIASKVVVRVAKSAGFKALAKRLGIAAGTSATLVGIPIGLLMGMGVAQRSSRASMRLRGSHPELFQELRREQGLDMLYFLVEKPMKPHLDAITAARNAARNAK